MKSLEELAAIRDKMKQTVNTREAAHDSTRVVVGMATCGIAAGARPVLNAFTEEVARRDLHGVLENFDHRCLNDVPPFDEINPTAEHLARVVFYELEKTFPAHISLMEVAVWESPAAKVVYRP